MLTPKIFPIIFLPAYFLQKILLNIFKLPGFSFSNPGFLALCLDLLFWAGSWAVSAIVYVTVRDGFKSYRERKREEGEEVREVS